MGRLRALYWASSVGLSPVNSTCFTSFLYVPLRVCGCAITRQAFFGVNVYGSSLVRTLSSNLSIQSERAASAAPIPVSSWPAAHQHVKVHLFIFLSCFSPRLCGSIIVLVFLGGLGVLAVHFCFFLGVLGVLCGSRFAVFPNLLQRRAHRLRPLHDARRLPLDGVRVDIVRRQVAQRLQV